MASVHEMPAVGRYLAREVGLLAGVSGIKVGQWARRGYIRSSVSEGRPRIYSYQDIAEAMVVHELESRNVSHRDIKTAIANLAEFGNWPLTRAPISTDSGRVYTREGDRTWDVGRTGWQQVVNPENLQTIANQLRRGGWAVRAEPGLEHIEVNPERLSGRPTIRGRRIAAAKVAAMATTLQGVRTLKRDYDLSGDEIADAVRWWSASTQLAA